MLARFIIGSFAIITGDENYFCLSLSVSIHWHINNHPAASALNHSSVLYWCSFAQKPLTDYAFTISLYIWLLSVKKCVKRKANIKHVDNH